MTAPAQFERLLDLARRVVPETTAGELLDLVMHMPPELRAKAPAALEAMLHVLLDEPQPFAVELASEWLDRRCPGCRNGLSCGECFSFKMCADELLAAAARGTP